MRVGVCVCVSLFFVHVFARVYIWCVSCVYEYKLCSCTLDILYFLCKLVSRTLKVTCECINT